MPQTLLALFAIFIATTFALQQQRAVLRSQLGTITSEINQQSLGVTAEVLEDVAGLSFDEQTTGGGPMVAPLLMTPEEEFGPEVGEGSYDAFDDVDDVHGMVHTITRQVSDPDTGALNDLPFEVTAEVWYVEEGPSGQLIESDVPTYKKLVEITVRCTALNGSWVNAETVMARLYTYPE